MNGETTQGGSDTKGGDGGGGGGIRMGRLRGPGSFSNKRTSEAGAKGAPGASGGGGGGYGDADVAKLKEAIQTLCQSTNPLGEINSEGGRGKIGTRRNQYLNAGGGG